MTDHETKVAHRERKALILAGGAARSSAQGGPLMLESLGDCSILECVVRNACEVVRPENIYIVVGDHLAAIRERLGAGYHYVRQEQALGTGHAVLQVAPLLQDFDGDLLILYGDTPLLRPATIRGLLNR